MAGVIIAQVAWAQPAPAAGAEPPVPPALSGAAPSGNAEAEARAHFKKGTDHFKKAEYREAYSEYLKSLELKPAKSAMAAAASSLKQLGRYDEALDLYEELRRKYPKLSATMEAKVGPGMAELQGLVGTLVIAGDAPAAASLFIDDRFRGKLPLAEPLRVAAGSHHIRVVKEGFDPITAVVEVSARKENVVQLVARSKKGLLSVSEKHSWALRVELDGKDVGNSPWEGLVEPGEHRVRLHGYMGAGALAACEAPEVKPGETAEPVKDGVKMGSPLEMATVMLYEMTKVVLSAEDQDASLKIESTPSGAIVKIDDRQVGLTPWEGRFGLGEHVIEVSAGGYLPARQRVVLQKRKQRELSLLLERERRLAPQGVPAEAKIAAGVAYGVGAVGLAVFAVTGGLVLGAAKDLKDTCPNDLCPGSQVERAKGLQDTAHTLGIVAPTALVISGVGATVGTVILFAARSRGKDKHATTRGVNWKVGMGLGGFQMEGSF